MNNEQDKQGLELTIVDLQNIRAILDVAARRGSFGGAELTSVGTVFNKLDTFLKMVEASQQAQQPQQPPADGNQESQKQV